MEGKPKAVRGRAVVRLDKQGQITATYTSLKDAAASNFCSYESVKAMCAGNKRTARLYPFEFRFATEEEAAAIMPPLKYPSKKKKKKNVNSGITDDLINARSMNMSYGQYRVWLSQQEVKA